jgi:hypothetical protein
MASDRRTPSPVMLLQIGNNRLTKSYMNMHSSEHSLLGNIPISIDSEDGS